MICLRGYLRLAGQTELSTDKRLAMCRDASALAQKDEIFGTGKPPNFKEDTGDRRFQKK